MNRVKLIKFLDKYVGYLFCLILSLSKIFWYRKSIKKDKILLIQLWGIGETILALPAIKALRDHNKKSGIDIVVTERVKEIFYKNRNLDDLKVLKLNPLSILIFILKNYKKYDLAIDIEEYLNISSIIAFFTGKERLGYSHGIRANLYTEKVDYNDRQHVVYTFLDLLKPLNIRTKVNKLLKLNYDIDDKKNIDKLLKNNNIGKRDFIVGFGIGAAESAKSRMWPKERFANLGNQLIKKYNAKIILIGNKEEKNLGTEIKNSMENKNSAFNFAGKVNIREMFYLISLCKLFIGNDSGPMHAAAAQQVITIGLFGCNLPLRFKPFGKNNFAIRKQTGAACINVHKGEVGECKFGSENACVRKIQVDDVVKLISKIRRS